MCIRDSAYATAAFVMGDDGASWVARINGYEALAVTTDRRTVWSAGLDSMLVAARPVPALQASQVPRSATLSDPLAGPRSHSPASTGANATQAGRVARVTPRASRSRLAIRALLGLLILVTATFEVNAVTGPDVTRAPELVTAIDMAHHSQPLTIAPDERIAVSLVAAEDDTFYSDAGVNVAALLRGLWGYLQGTDAGGSTIEVQLAHMLYPANASGLWGRVHLVTAALAFDTHYTKVAILSMYLDAAYFGHGFFGVDAASNGYFGVQQAQLSWTQAALLAGLVQAPSTLDPFAHLAAATHRMDYVLQRLAATGRLTQAQAWAAATAALHLRRLG